MIASLHVRWKVLWREDHIWAYYSGLLALFLGRFWFAPGDLPALISLYGWFVTQLTLIILDQHRRHGMEKLVRLTEVRPFGKTVNEILFSSVCAFPAAALLILLLHDIFPATPVYLLVLLTAEFIVFAIGFAFACSVFPFKYGAPISLLFYFVLLANHGYKLEHVPYLAPTLNFMYPDYPDVWNAAAILALSLIFFTLYLWLKFDRDRISRRRMQELLVCVLAIYAAVPTIHHIQEKVAAAAPYQRLEVSGLTVHYQGVPKKQAERYAQVVEDMQTAMEKRGLKPQVTQLIITRKKDVPQNEGVEHILHSDGSALYIEPYSNKFYEFNYGYNIVRDLSMLWIDDPTERREVAQAMIAEDKRGYFRAARIRLGIED